MRKHIESARNDEGPLQSDAGLTGPRDAGSRGVKSGGRKRAIPS